MADAGDRAQALEEWFREMSLRARDRAARAAAGNWRPEDERCVDCAQPIGTERLRVVPHAVRCIDCAVEFEIGKHREPEEGP